MICRTEKQNLRGKKSMDFCSCSVVCSKSKARLRYLQRLTAITDKNIYGVMRRHVTSRRLALDVDFIRPMYSYLYFFSFVVELLIWTETIVVRYRDEHILSKCGLDAVQYLSFQRNIILLVGIINLISLGIVLPINFAGLLEGGPSAFGHTTVSNIHPQ